LTAAAELLQTGGQNPLAVRRDTSLPSPRRRGVKHGLFIFLLTFFFVPIVAMISMALRLDPGVAGAASVLFFMGGVLRMVYAWMFESTEPGAPTIEEKVMARVFKTSRSQPHTLAPQSSIPIENRISSGTGNWRDTNDLQPVSVVEGTTKLLEKDQQLH
jgi:hypothetical protein